jgi:hypothetical protein
VNVETKRHKNDEFGRVISGSLTLTGPLGVLRLEHDAPESKDIRVANFYHKKRMAKMFSDSMALPKSHPLTGANSFRRYMTVGPDWKPSDLNLFYMPIRLMDEFFDGMSVEKPILKGLLLKPIGNKKGEYERIGMFETSDVWEGNCVQAFRCNRTDIQSSKYLTLNQGTRYTITVI